MTMHKMKIEVQVLVREITCEFRFRQRIEDGLHEVCEIVLL